MKKANSMLETIMVLLVFFIILAVCMVIYVRFQASGNEDKTAERLWQQSSEVYKEAISLPEIQCSQNNAIEQNCVDNEKIMALQDFMAKNSKLAGTYYFDRFGNSLIKVEQIYPVPAPGKNETVIYSNVPANFKNKVSTRVPIMLLLHNQGTNGFGVMIVEYYS